MFRQGFERLCAKAAFFYPENDRITWLNTKSYANGFWDGALSFAADGHCSYFKQVILH